MNIKFTHVTKMNRDDLIKNETLSKFFVWWDEIPEENWGLFAAELEEAKVEEDVQSFLAQNPEILVQCLGGGHGRWAIPKFKFGSEYVADFVIGDKDSIGYEWLLVELESPNAKMFTKAGNPTKELTHAIKQIQEWRVWIRDNHDYVSRSSLNNGLGLVDIHDRVPGMILIGREKDNPTDNNKIRRQMCIDLNIEIHSFDYIIRKGSRINEVMFYHKENY